MMKNNAIETMARRFRAENNLSLTEPISAKTILRKLNILTMYRPMSDGSYGISVRAGENRFMLINSNSTRGRQHYTIAHELYHLFYDENPQPHLCSNGQSNPVERKANLFASALLMPADGMLQMIPVAEQKGSISLATILRLEQYFGVSRTSLLVRLKELGLMTEAQLNVARAHKPCQDAIDYGYDTSLYKSGNEGVVIGDFGEKARLLYESDRISEGHYHELLNMIEYGSR